MSAPVACESGSAGAISGGCSSSANPTLSALASVPLSSLLSIVLNTSACLAHPGTFLLEEVVASLHRFLPGSSACRLLLVADGYRITDAPALKRGRVDAAQAAAYERYLARIAEATRATSAASSPLRGAELLALYEQHGCAHALRRGLLRISTPFVLVVQHDRPMIAAADLASLCAALQASSDINYIGLPTSMNACGASGHGRPGLPSALWKPEAARIAAGLRLVPLAAFIDSTHVARTEWYLQFVFGRMREVKLPRGSFLEDVFGQAQLAALRCEGVTSHRRFGTWLLHEGPDQVPLVAHLDGRDTRIGWASCKKWRHADAHTREDLWEVLEGRESGLPSPPRLLGFYDKASEDCGVDCTDESNVGDGGGVTSDGGAVADSSADKESAANAHGELGSDCRSSDGGAASEQC